MVETAFTSEHEAELAEIKALSSDLNERLKEGLATLQEIRESQEKALRGGVEPLLAFVHIPKTAGGTVISMFAAAYSKQAVRDGGNYLRSPEKTVSAVANPRKRRGRVLAGHVPYRVYRDHLPSDTRYMTFLREPVDRVLSHYYRHVLAKDPRVEKSVRRPGRGGNRPDTPQELEVKADLLEEALVERRLPHLTNLCTRFLCGHASPLEDLPASAVDDAKEVVSQFAFVGIQERFEESLVLLQRLLGLGSIPYQDRHVSLAGGRPSVDELPDEQRALIVEHNQLDAELYRFGLGLFENAVAGAGDGFAEDVEALRARSATAREEEWHETRSAQG
jgi:hypothetical protein